MRAYEFAALGSLVVTVILGQLAAPAARGQSVEEKDADELSVVREHLPEPPPAVDTAEARQGILERTNQFREQEGLQPLTPDTHLVEAAKHLAEYMARTGKYGHTADDQRPSERAAERGYDVCLVRENIAYHYTSEPLDAAELAENFVTGWKKSEGHRENMLDGDAMHTGVAVARNQSGYYFAVQMFGRPQSAAIEFVIENQTGRQVDYELLHDGRVDRYTVPPLAAITHQRCRSPRIRLAEPKSAETHRAQAGDRFVIRGEGDSLRLEAVE